MKGKRAGTTAFARVLLAIGGLAAAFVWWGFAAKQTILDPAATRATWRKAGWPQSRCRTLRSTRSPTNSST